MVPPMAVDNQVWEDNIFVVQEEWDRINGKALIDTEIVNILHEKHPPVNTFSKKHKNLPQTHDFSDKIKGLRLFSLLNIYVSETLFHTGIGAVTEKL